METIAGNDGEVECEENSSNKQDPASGIVHGHSRCSALMRQVARGEKYSPAPKSLCVDARDPQRNLLSGMKA
jgi:hypothetical protein